MKERKIEYPEGILVPCLLYSSSTIYARDDSAKLSVTVPHVCHIRKQTVAKNALTDSRKYFTLRSVLFRVFVKKTRTGVKLSSRKFCKAIKEG